MTIVLSDALRPIRDRFLVALADRERAVRAALASLEAGGRDPSALEAARYAVHKTAGTAKTLGFPELGAVARACDDGFVALGRGTGDAALVNLLTEFLRQSADIRARHA